LLKKTLKVKKLNKQAKLEEHNVKEEKKKLV
jgi:hypothetical protein